MQEELEQQKKKVEIKLKEYMEANKLSWEKVNTVLAIVKEELGSAGLSDDEAAEVTKQMAEAGAMVVYLKDLAEKKKAAEAAYKQLGEEHKLLEGAVKGAQAMYPTVMADFLKKTDERADVNAKLETERGQLQQFQAVNKTYAADILTGWLALAMLLSPENVSDTDFDLLVQMMITMRQIRLGNGPRKAVDVNGKVICECPLPMPSPYLQKYDVTMEDIRTKLALCLAPALKDKFDPRPEFVNKVLDQALAQTQQNLVQLVGALSGIPAPGSLK